MTLWLGIQVPTKIKGPRSDDEQKVFKELPKMSPDQDKKFSGLSIEVWGLSFLP